MDMMGRPLAAVLAVAMATGAAASVAAPRGMYFNAGLGLSGPTELESARVNVGIPTNCDQWLQPGYTFADGTSVPLPADECAPRELPSGANRFDLDAGLLAGVGVGYAFSRFRVEAEYTQSTNEGETRDLIVAGDGKQPEFTERSESIGDVDVRGIFINGYRDFGEPGGSGIRPYLGVGLGWMDMEVEYAATSIRTSSRDELIALGRNPDAAGTVTRADDTMSDTLFGYQLLAGFDYPMRDKLTLGVKLRYGEAFGKFGDRDKDWRQLRGHASTVGPGGAPVRYGIEADDISFWGISIDLKWFP